MLLSLKNLKRVLLLLTTTNKIVLAGEVRPGLISTEEMVNIARERVRDIGYEQDGFHWQNAYVDVYVHAQPKHISQGVDSDGGNKDEGAGDQGNMFGYACRKRTL